MNNCPILDIYNGRKWVLVGLLRTMAKGDTSKFLGEYLKQMKRNKAPRGWDINDCILQKMLKINLNVALWVVNCSW